MPAGELNTRQRAVLLTLMVAGREVTNPELHAAHGLRLDGADRRRLNQAGLVTSRRVGRSFAHELTDRGWRACRDELRAAPPRAPGSLGAALYAVLAGLDAYLDRAGLRLADVFGDTGAVVTAGPDEGDTARADATGSDRAGTTTGPAATPPGPSEPAAAGPGARATSGPATAEDRIREAYRRLATRPRGWVSLTDLRRTLTDLRRTLGDGAATGAVTTGRATTGDDDEEAAGRGTARAEVDAALRALYRTPAVNLVPESNQKALTDEDRAAAVHIGGEDKHLLSIDLTAERG